MLIFVKGFFPVFFLVYFLQLIFKASTRFTFCFSLVKEKVFDIDLDNELEVMITSLIEKIGETHGIEITDHSFEMYGQCNTPGKHL